jgi:hypothetical protein
LPAALQSRVAGNPGADLLPFLLAHGRAEPGAAPVALALNSNLHARLELAGREGATA